MKKYAFLFLFRVLPDRNRSENHTSKSGGALSTVAPAFLMLSTLHRNVSTEQ